MAGRVVSGRRFLPFGPYLALATLVVLFTWRWIWGFEIEWRPGTTVAVREFFGDWPALLIMAAIGVGLLVLLLGLLRLYRAIPVPAAHRRTRAATVAPRDRTATVLPAPAAARPGARLFAVIPAAGHSRRMGRPKLLLPLGEATVMARLLAALEHPAIAARLVVVRPDDEPLRAEVQRSGGIALQPVQPPPDMRTSVEHALASIQERFAPRPDDGWLLVPADHPVLDRGLVDRVIAEWQTHRPEVLVPTCGGRRGHPTVFRWNLAAAVSGLPSDCGLNQLVRDSGREVLEVELGDPAVLTDLDTPADYKSLAARWPET
jgi:molybdenum cofactor cytidylyltransferase